MALRATLLFLAAVLAATSSRAQVSQAQPDPKVFAAVQDVGDLSSGDSVAMYGCSDNGATLSYLSLWANNNFIRGMQVRLTDGREVLFGCLNTTQTPITVGCSGSGNRNADFTFQPGELVTNLTLWPGYNDQGQANQRAGAINMMTSKGRTFDFGMTNTRNNPTNVNPGSGIPCGVAPRAGADIDALGFVFLLPVTLATLEDVQYQGVPASQVDAVDTNSTVLVLNSEVYNNSGKTEALVSTYTSDSVLEMPTTWSHATGLDDYLTSNVTAATPQLTTGGSNGTNVTGWALGPEGSYTREGAPLVPLKWNYTVDTAAGAVSEATASVVQAQITTSYSGNLTVVLSSGATISFPVDGTYEGSVTSPVTIAVEQIQAPPPAAVSAATATEASSPGSNGSGSGGSNNTSLILGLVFGILGGLFFAVLVAWAVVIIMRHRAQQDESDAAAAAGGQGPGAGWPGPGWFFIPAIKGKGADVEKGMPLPDPKTGESGESEVDNGSSGGSFSFWGLRSKKGKQGGWGDEMDPKMDAVMGVPVPAGKEIEMPAQAPRATQEAPEGSSRPYMPYSVFRKLRLDSIRGALGLAGPSGEGDHKAGLDISSDSDSLYSAPQPIPPASLACGKDSVPANPALDELHAEDLAESDKVESPTAATADGDEEDVFDDAHSVADTDAISNQSFPSMQTPGPSVAGSVAGDSKAPSFISGDSRGRIMRLKDRFAAQMATRRAAMTQPAGADAKDAASAEPIPAKEPSRLAKLARSVSSSLASRSSSIQHDNVKIAVKGAPKRPTSTAKPADDVSGGVLETELPDEPKTPTGEGQAEQAPSKRSKIVEHEDATLALGKGYQSPPEAKSVPRRNELDLDDTRLRLGEGYRTQGRNE